MIEFFLCPSSLIIGIEWSRRRPVYAKFACSQGTRTLVEPRTTERFLEQVSTNYKVTRDVDILISEKVSDRTSGRFWLLQTDTGIQGVRCSGGEKEEAFQSCQVPVQERGRACFQWELTSTFKHDGS